MAVNLDSFKTLHIKRYSTEELIEFGTEALIQHLAKGHEIIIGDKISDIGDIPAFISKNISNAIPNMQELVRVYSEIAPLVVKDDERKIFLDNIEAYKTDLERVELTSLEDLVEYDATHSMKSIIVETTLVIPINKKLNSLYDNFGLEAKFIQSFAMPKANKLEELSKATPEERVEIIRNNIKITHMSLVIPSESIGRSVGVNLFGKLEPEYTDPQKGDCMLLPPEFSDFSKVTLADCENIENNDLKQLIQEEIDMDKENLAELDVRMIGEDLYKLMKAPTSEELYIRYVCPSTGRVYYNAINLRNLRLSEFYKEEDIATTIPAWWSIMHLGANPYTEKAVIRC